MKECDKPNSHISSKLHMIHILYLLIMLDTLLLRPSLHFTQLHSTSLHFTQYKILLLIYSHSGYGLDSPGIESRWGARFFAHVQTGPGAHPASCTMGTGSFPRVNRPGRGADHPPSSSAEVTNEKSYTSNPTLALRGLL
jgi:hypothetical protein